MNGFQGKGKNTEELVQLYEKLEQDWHAMKQNSNSKTASSRRYNYHHHAPPSSNATMESESMEQRRRYYCYSPRDIMNELQRESTPSPPPEEGEEEWNNNAMIVMRNKEFEAREVLRERVEAIERGKLKGRRLLFNPTEDTESFADDVGLSPRPEVRSILSYDSDDEHEEGYTSGSKRVHGFALRCCCYSSSASSSSSSSCRFGAHVNSDQEVQGVGDLAARVSEMRVAGAVDRLGKGGRRKRFADFLRWLAFAFLVIAICVSLTRSSGGHDDSEVVLVPT